jgi:hypothetical protein
MLARVDGDSPLDYIAEPRHESAVRRIARRLILDPPADPAVALALATDSGS